MAGKLYIESHSNLRDHPKLLRLARALGVEKLLAIGYLHCLWWWAAKYADDGITSDWEPGDIADGAEWRGEASAFSAALKKSGFMDDDGRLHDWDDYFKLASVRKYDRERKTKGRKVRRKSTGSPKEVHGKSTGSPPLPDRTRPNLTGQDQTEPNPSHTPLPPNGGACTLVEQVVNDLNEKSGKAFRPSGETATLINARIKEGATLENFLHVHRVKCEQWRGTEWDKVLRPSTLYRKCNFDGYVNEKTKDQLETDKKAQELADFERRIAKPSIFRTGGA